MYKLNISRKGLLYAAELEKGVDLTAGYVETSYDDEYTKALDFLSKIFLENHETGEKFFIKSVKGHESELDHLEIIVGDDEQNWKFMIKCEEVMGNDEDQ